MEEKRPSLTVDIIIQREDSILLVRRKFPPFKGFWALPGGFVEYGETVEQSAVREAKEETGLQVKLEGLVGVYSDPARDPRGHTIAVAFQAAAPTGELKPSRETEPRWFDLGKLPENLAFDHSRILSDVKAKFYITKTTKKSHG